MLFYLRRLKKHDKVLYRFCQLRRETMSIIREANFDLKPEDYAVLRALVEKTSDTIHDFNNCKVSLFNVRKLSEQVSRAKMIEALDVENPQIQKLCLGYTLAMLRAFFTFTPFIKSELGLRVAPYLLRALASLGGNYLKIQVKKMNELILWIKQESEEHGAALAAS